MGPKYALQGGSNGTFISKQTHTQFAGNEQIPYDFVGSSISNNFEEYHIIYKKVSKQENI